MKYIKKITESVDNKELTILSTDDWQGLYYNGELLDEGHSVNLYNVLRGLGYNIEYIDIDDPEEFENYFGANCPETLDEVKLKLAAKKYNL
jgi:hypothetical protein